MSEADEKTIQKLEEAGYEIVDLSEVEEAPALPKRAIGVSLVVDRTNELPESAWDIAEFTNILREQIGEFDHVEIGVQVNPRGATSQEKDKFMGFVKTDAISNDVLEEEEYYDDDDYEDEEGKKKVRKTAK